MNSTKYRLALALSMVTTISASIPRDEIVTHDSPAIQDAQISEQNNDAATEVEISCTAAITLIKSDIQALANDEQAPQSDLHNQAQQEDAHSEECTNHTTETESDSELIEISIEQAQTIFDGDIAACIHGFIFEHGGKKYIVTAIFAEVENQEHALEQASHN